MIETRKPGRPKLGNDKQDNTSIGIGRTEYNQLKKDMNRLGLKSMPELIRYYLRLSNGLK